MRLGTRPVHRQAVAGTRRARRSFDTLTNRFSKEVEFHDTVT